MEALDLGEAFLDALVLRVAPPPGGDAPFLRPLSDEAPSRGKRFGPRIIGVELLDEGGHGDTEPEGGHLEASLALSPEQGVQLFLRQWKLRLQTEVLQQVLGNVSRGFFYDQGLALGPLGDVRLGGADRL